jgi:CspA family cold shock protein
MATGKVRFYNDSKGFGLITPDIAGPALFAHASAIRGTKKLRVAQLVEFDIENRPEGPTALNIRLLK